MGGNRHVTKPLRRVLAMGRKELIEIVRDPSSFGIAFVLPLLLLILFGYGVSLDLEHLPVAVVYDSLTPSVSDVLGRLVGSRYIEPRIVPSVDEATRMLGRGDVLAIVRIRSDFPSHLHRADRDGEIQILVNGTDANTAQLARAYLTAAIRMATPDTATQGVRLEGRLWFNQRVDSSYFLVPGTTAVILTLLGAMLTALVVAREYELGTIEKLQSTPLGATELVLAKLAPYFLLGAGGAAFTFATAIFVFGVPFRGSYWVLALASSLYLIVSLAVGLIISTLAKSQFVSAEATMIIAFLPSFMLSGFVFEIRSMPVVLQKATYLFPPRYLVTCLQTAFLAGDVMEVLVPNLAALALFAVALVLLAVRVVRRTLRAVS